MGCPAGEEGIPQDIGFAECTQGLEAPAHGVAGGSFLQNLV